MEIHEAIRQLDIKFTSGNAIDVERSTITRPEYEAIRKIYDTLYAPFPAGPPTDDSNVGC